MADDKTVQTKSEIATFGSTLKYMLIASPIIATALMWMFGTANTLGMLVIMIAGIFLIQHYAGPSRWAKPVMNFCVVILFVVIVWSTAGNWAMKSLETQFPGLGQHIAMKQFGWWADRQLANREVMPVAVRLIDDQLAQEETAEEARIAKLLKEGKAIEAAQAIAARKEKKAEVHAVLHEKSGEANVMKTSVFKKGDPPIVITLNPGQTSQWIMIKLEGNERVSYSIQNEEEKTCDVIYADGDIVHLGREDVKFPYKASLLLAVKNTSKVRHIVRITWV